MFLYRVLNNIAESLADTRPVESLRGEPGVRRDPSPQLFISKCTDQFLSQHHVVTGLEKQTVVIVDNDVRQSTCSRSYNNAACKHRLETNYRSAFS